MKNAALAVGFSVVLIVLTATSAGAVPEQHSAPAWDVQVRPGTRLAALKGRFTAQVSALPPGDAEDRSRVPGWFRAYLRASFPGLPTAGPYQYPHTARRMLDWMAAHPNFTAAALGMARRPPDVRVTMAGENVDVSRAPGQVNNESAVARNPVDSRYVIAASNTRDPVDSWVQRQFFSVNSGLTWGSTSLPLTAGRDYHADPSLAYSSDGSTAWAATLGFRTSDDGATVYVQVYKSADQGASWSHAVDVSTEGANDKPMMWVDTHATSPFKDHIYLAWNTLSGDNKTYPRQSQGIWFARYAKTGSGWSWSTPALLTKLEPVEARQATGVHLATGPKGELYVAWPETNRALRKLRVVKSEDGGATFKDMADIATTYSSYRNSIPAMDGGALTYLTLAVDRSGRADPAPVYAAWTDCAETAVTACQQWNTGASSTRVYFSASINGGASWLGKPVIPFPNEAAAGMSWDQFNPWLDVGPDGSIHLALNDTREDKELRRKAHVYYTTSRDGGSSWDPGLRVTTDDTDETLPDAAIDQYGDYNGLVALASGAIATWTDRRDPGSAAAPKYEQIFSSRLLTLRIPACLLRPGFCTEPTGMGPGELILKCARRPCMVVDPLPKNCLVKFSCPVCKAKGQCPQRLRVKLDGLGRAWKVGLLGPDGEPVSHETEPTRTGVIVDFRPDPRTFQAGQLGNYALTFELQRAGSVETSYRVKTALEVLE